MAENREEDTKFGAKEFTTQWGGLGDIYKQLLDSLSNLNPSLRTQREMKFHEKKCK